MTVVTDIDYERYNPIVAEARYRKEGRSEAEVQMLKTIAAALYARPPEEVRAMVAKRREAGLPIY